MEFEDSINHYFKGEMYKVVVLEEEIYEQIRDKPDRVTRHFGKKCVAITVNGNSVTNLNEGADIDVNDLLELSMEVVELVKRYYNV
ncbi:MAG: hypothetical protein HUJ25_12420 [Crocinitomicaceae bacterium]|nr:hypothetical protein [Crocinitomicaceae bacterium]